MNLEIHILDTNIADLGLSNRSVNSLKKANITNLRELLSQELTQIKGLGRISRKEIEELLTLITKKYSEDGSTFEYLIEIEESKKIYHYINTLIKVILSSQKDDRLLKIIQLRFGLVGNNEYSLTDIGEAYELTRERVRQIEEYSLDLIKKVIFGKALYYTLQLPQSIIVEAQELYSTLKESSAVQIETEMIKLIEDHYRVKFDYNYLPELRFIFILFGFIKLPSYLFGPSIKTYDTWILSDSVDQELLIQSVIRIRDSLKSHVISTNLFDLKILLNKGQKTKINSEYINYSLPISSEIEKLDNEEYQIKFEFLPTIVDKAYRILVNKKSPMHINEILKEINHRLAISDCSSKVLIQSLRGEILADDRFDVIGRSSVYFLKEWGNISKSSISELIEEHFMVSNRGTNFADIFDYVKLKRPAADRKSVYTILKLDDKFIKVGKNNYELRAWGNKEHIEEPIVRIHRVKEIILNYFQENDATETTLPELKNYIENEFSIPSTTFYQIVYKLPFLKITKSENSRARKAIFISNYEQPVTKNEKLETREKAIEAIFSFLSDKEDKILLKELMNHVISKTNIKKPTLYKLLNEVEEIQKEQIGTKYYVSIKDKISHIDLLEDEHKSEISNLTDSEIKLELKNIFNMLSPDSIDVVFFRLGKIYENEIRKYLLYLQKNGTKINNKTFFTLSNMINYIQVNKLIKNADHLTILREKRNECAHEILSNSTKKKLMKHAPFYIDLFLRYIFKFNGMHNNSTA